MKQGIIFGSIGTIELNRNEINCKNKLKNNKKH